jgi:hypothetical protein
MSSREPQDAEFSSSITRRVIAFRQRNQSSGTGCFLRKAVPRIPCFRRVNKSRVMLIDLGRTPKRNHSNRPSPSSGDSSFSALGSNKHTLFKGMLDSASSPITPGWWKETLAKLSSFASNVDRRKSRDDFDK